MRYSHLKKIELLREIEGKSEFTLKELVCEVNRLLPVFVPKQKRYKVTGSVNERIIRYYLNEGLVDKPCTYRGRYALFSAGHVLQILVVKYLQASYVPLKKILDIRLILSRSDQKRMLLDGDAGDLIVSGIVGKREKPPRDIVEKRKTDALPPERKHRSWKRFKIHDQVELTVEKGFDIHDKDTDLEKIISKVLIALSSAGQECCYDADAYHRTHGFESLNLGYMSPAIPLFSREKAVIALITEGGLVPRGNPDKLASARARRFFKYNIRGVDELRFDKFESIDRGWDNIHVNNDPNRLLPLDIMREFEKKREFSRLHHYFYTTTGAGTSIASAKKMGKKIAAELRADGVSAVLMTAT